MLGTFSFIIKVDQTKLLSAELRWHLLWKERVNLSGQNCKMICLSSSQRTFVHANRGLLNRLSRQLAWKMELLCWRNVLLEEWTLGCRHAVAFQCVSRQKVVPSTHCHEINLEICFWIPFLVDLFVGVVLRTRAYWVPLTTTNNKTKCFTNLMFWFL